MDSIRSSRRGLRAGRMVFEFSCPSSIQHRLGAESRPRIECGSHAAYYSGSTRCGVLGHCAFQRRLFRAAIVVDTRHGIAIGGIVFGQVVGYLLDHGFGYGFVFLLAGSFHVVAFFVILGAIPVFQPITVGRKLMYQEAR